MFRALVQGAHIIRTGEQATPLAELNLADDLRNMVCAALVKHRADMEPFITGMKFEDYVNQMALPDTWGGEPELAIAADVLGLPIVVYQVDATDDLTETSTYGSDYLAEGEHPVSVLYDGVGHYDLLVDSNPTGTQVTVPLRPLSKL